MQCETGGLGISAKALCVRASEINLQSLPKSAQQGQGEGPAVMLLHAGFIDGLGQFGEFEPDTTENHLSPYILKTARRELVWYRDVWLGYNH